MTIAYSSFGKLKNRRKKARRLNRLVIPALCVIALVAVVCVAHGQVAPTWTPRPTGQPGTPTYEVFLPLVQDGEPAATPKPRPTMIW